VTGERAPIFDDLERTSATPPTTGSRGSTSSIGKLAILGPPSDRLGAHQGRPDAAAPARATARSGCDGRGHAAEASNAVVSGPSAGMPGQDELVDGYGGCLRPTFGESHDVIARG
jgi:hypothetical protein